MGLETSAVVIGEEAWLRDGTTGPWEATSVAALRNDGSADLTSLDPGFFLYETEMDEVLAALRATDEVRAGIETVRYEVTPEAFEALAVVPRNVVHRREAGTAPPTPPCGRR